MLGLQIISLTGDNVLFSLVLLLIGLTFVQEFPFFSAVYINDIVNDIWSNIRLVADDTSLFIIVDDPVTAAGVLTQILENFSLGFNLACSLQSY